MTSIESADSTPWAQRLHLDNKRIRLQIGERCFHTRFKTLTDGCIYFDEFFSNTDGGEDLTQSDEPIFLDLDGDVFAHILRYQRSKTFPLFYTHANGFDYGLYVSVLQMAEYLGIEKLAAWIRGQRYLYAIKQGFHSDTNSVEEKTRGDVRTFHYPQWKTMKVYVCPRGIYQHRGDKAKCGKVCDKARGDAEDLYEDELVGPTVWRVHKTTSFDDRVCTEGKGALSGV